jgi:23S rRNA (uracil1939-C5)-methyltransferase
MDWKKNDLVEMKIEDMSDTGEGIGKTDGFTWFVKDAVIGDRVRAKVMKTKKSYGFARLMEVLEPSSARVEPACPVARQCGGCQLQAMSYEEQLRFKEKKVFNNLKRIGGFENLVCVDEDGSLRDSELTAKNTERGTSGIACEKSELMTESEDASKGERKIPFLPIIGMENPWRYRNKAQFPFGCDRDGRIVTGFYAGRTHDIIESEDCLLGVEENAKILACIKAYMEEYKVAPYNEAAHSGLVRHALIRKGFRTDELMVCLVINGPAKALKHSEVLVERLCALYPEQMKSISCSINTEKTNVIMGRDIVNLYGPGYITDDIGSVHYRISPLSFYQVNPVQTERLYSTALEYAGLTGDETVWDLYCGIGTISLFLAQKAKKVYGVEIIPAAIEDARANAALNGFTNTEFFVGKAEEVLPEQYEKNHTYADVIVVDPPRKGCDQLCLDTILKMSPKKVVYVSCDSATLARDLKHLCANGYRLEKVRAVDQFPGSTHVETVVSIRRMDA